MRILLLYFFIANSSIFAAEHILFDTDRYNQIPNNIVRIQSEASGMFTSAYKNFFQFTVAQNVPGVKESAVGYYYDYPSQTLKQVHFHKFENGYPRKTSINTDFALAGEGFFVLKDKEGQEIYTRDGRFSIHQSGVLVHDIYGFPVLGENGVIVTGKVSQIDVDNTGVVMVDNEVIDSLKVVAFEYPINLTSLTPSLFYFEEGLSARDKKLKLVNYEVKQGFVEDSSVMKELAGQLSEYMFGQDANVKMTRFYMRSMSQSIQAANP